MFGLKAFKNKGGAGRRQDDADLINQQRDEVRGGASFQRQATGVTAYDRKMMTQLVKDNASLRAKNAELEAGGSGAKGSQLVNGHHQAFILQRRELVRAFNAVARQSGSDLLSYAAFISKVVPTLGDATLSRDRRGALAAPELSTAPHHHAAPNHDCDRPGHL